VAIAITLRGFNDRGRSVTPIFQWSFSLLIFYVSRKNEKNLLSRSLNLFKMLYGIPFISPLRLAVQQFQMPLQALRLVKMMAIFEIITATDSLRQNIRIVCLMTYL